MTFLASSLSELLQFLKIIMWISLPLFLVSTLVVVFLHYRKKRKQALMDISAYGLDADYQLAPAISAAPSGFIKDYQQELQERKEQYRALEKDFRQVKQNFAALLAGSDNSTDEPASNEIQKQLKQYELKMAQLQQAFDYIQSTSGKEEDLVQTRVQLTEKEQEIKRLLALTESLNRELLLLKEQNDSKSAEIHKMDQLLKELQESARQASLETRGMHLSFQQETESRDRQHFEENKRLNDQLKELHENFRKLEEENHHLKIKLQENRIEQGNEGEVEKRITDLQNALIKAEQELLVWKNKIVDAESLKEILEERKSHAEFLQNQLEQRIRLNRQLEQRNADAEQQLAIVQQELESATQKQNYLQEDRLLKEEELQQMTRQIEEGIAENRDLKQQILDRDDRLHRAESEIKSLRSRVLEYEEELNRHHEITNALEEQLMELNSHKQNLENRWKERQELLHRLHNELALLVNSKKDGSDQPVSALQMVEQ